MRRLWIRLLSYFDPSVRAALKILLLFVVMSAVFIYVGFQASTDIRPGQCSLTGLPARCYHVSEHICNLTWAESEKSCREYVEKLSLPPGRLKAPIQIQCQMVRFDQAFSNLRKSKAECIALHTDLVEWKRRNDFK